MKNWIRHAWQRINWRVGFALAVYIAAPRVGLAQSQVAAVREAAATIIVISFLAWANHEGRRQRQDPRRGAGILGARPEGKE